MKLTNTQATNLNKLIQLHGIEIIMSVIEHLDLDSYEACDDYLFHDAVKEEVDAHYSK